MKKKGIVGFFDSLEDRVRVALSHRPILYAFVGGVGIVLFWKGVWETAEIFPALHGPMSILLGVFIMLITGLFVSFFIGDSIVLSGLKHEKKLAERTEAEVLAERDLLQELKLQLNKIESEIHEIKSKS